MQVGISLPVREMQDDLAAIREFAQTAEELGFTHLRIPDQVARPGAGHLHEPLTLLSWLAGFTEKIELVPSVIILPARETVLVAKQAAEIDILSNGRLRMGVGVGRSPEEYESLGQDFTTRGRRCDEQIELLKLLWKHETVEFAGRFHHVNGLGINPLPEHEIPIWIGHGPVNEDGELPRPVLRRIARSDGWFAVLSRDHFPAAHAEISRLAAADGRDPSAIGIEGAIGCVGREPDDWIGELRAWEDLGATHLCLRTLGAGLDSAGHLAELRSARDVLDTL
jgi:probable F420-dependent oxidoreductase